MTGAAKAAAAVLGAAAVAALVVGVVYVHEVARGLLLIMAAFAQGAAL